MTTERLVQSVAGPAADEDRELAATILQTGSDAEKLLLVQYWMMMWQQQQRQGSSTTNTSAAAVVALEQLSRVVLPMLLSSTTSTTALPAVVSEPLLEALLDASLDQQPLPQDGRTTTTSDNDLAPLESCLQQVAAVRNKSNKWSTACRILQRLAQWTRRQVQPQSNNNNNAGADGDPNASSNSGAAAAAMVTSALSDQVVWFLEQAAMTAAVDHGSLSSSNRDGRATDDSAAA